MAPASETSGRIDVGRADVYEREIVPWFKRWADHLVDVAAPHPAAHVLDVACGTGLAARIAASRLGVNGRVVAIDAGEAMLEVARAVPDLNNPPIEWRLGDAEALPSTDATFDLVLCNEGLQFFAQPMRALEEMRRVLRPNGRLALAIWRPIQHQQGLERLVDVLEQHLTPHAADLRGMSRRWERTDLRNLVASVGFADVHIRIDPGSVRWPSVDACLSTTLGGSPLASAFDDLSTEARVALVRQLEKQAGDDYIDDDGVIVPFEAYVLSARR